MRAPLPPGMPIDNHRMAGWVGLFSGYRHAVTEQRVDRWLNQFRTNDRDLAARALDCVDFITHEQMAAAFRSILNSLNGWSRDANFRQGRWRFVAFSTSAGQSGDSMLHRFRLANGLSGRQYNELFIYKSQLLSENLGPEDTVVFVDDFSATGTQACDGWGDIEELLPGDPTVFLVLVAASSAARERIGNETGLTVVPHIELTEQDNIYLPACGYFTQHEKDTLLRYCRVADNRYPRGFGNCGFVIVFAHNCPNNSIPILHGYHPRWEGLFRKHD